MELFGITGVAGITIIYYLCGMAVKASPLESKFIPVICGALGGLLGILALRLMPEYPAQDLINAAAVGIASGLAATGIDQSIKQLGS